MRRCVRLSRKPSGPTRQSGRRRCCVGSGTVAELANRLASEYCFAAWKEGDMSDQRRKILSKYALRLEQNRSHPLYLFSLTREEIETVSDISRLARDEGGKLLGYQRGEVRQHIQDIV